MRKKLMLILCLILCAGMLAACSGGNQNERFPVISTQSIQKLRRCCGIGCRQRFRTRNARRDPWWMN